MAALASVSITAAYGATPIPENTDYSFDWTQVPGTPVTRTVTKASGSGGIYYADSPWGKYIILERGETLSGVNTLCAVNQSGTSNNNTYIDVHNTPFATRLLGLGWLTTLNGSGSLYLRSVGSTSHEVAYACGMDPGTGLRGNLYMELDTPDTYKGSSRGVSVAASDGGRIYGSSTVVIRQGTYLGTVVGGFSSAEQGIEASIAKGSYLQISGGTFEAKVVAGNSSDNTTYSSTIIGGTHLLVKATEGSAPIFNHEIIGGNADTVSYAKNAITGGVSMRLEAGTYNKKIYGGSIGRVSTIEGGIDLTITGGTFNKTTDTVADIFALGYSGTVTGNVNLTIEGDSAKFSDGYRISAGYRGTGASSVAYSGGTSTVTLKDISSNTSNSLASNSSITVDGGQQKSKLVMDNVDTTIQAQLSQFSTMSVTNGSDLTLTHDSNATLGGVSSVTVNGNSILSLEHAAGQAWTEYAGRIDVEDGSKLHLSGPTNAKLNLASGSTLSVKEGDLFAAAPASGYNTLSGVTLEANEGNWTINKAINVNGATITGSHAVAFGSEVDSNAKVTMSGNIDATEGNLLLKNTAIATKATLSGNITFEGKVDNKGTLAIANGSTINIDAQSLIRNGRFIESNTEGEYTDNGFFADKTVCLSSGGTYSYSANDLQLALNGEEDTSLELKTADGGLHIYGLAEKLENTYFVRKGNVEYSHITGVSNTLQRKVNEIAIGNDGIGDEHQLTLDSSWDNSVTITSVSDHAKVSVAENVVLDASKTEIKGEANEVHVTGAGSVRIDADSASKLSQLAGDATMKVDTTTTFNSEAKMTGALKVGVKEGESSTTLTVTDAGTIASFSSVDLGSGATLKNEVVIDDSIKSLSGSGTLEKTGTGKLAISGDSHEFAGSVNIGGGTLEVQNAMNANTLSGSGKLAKTGTGNMTVKDASGFKGDIEATSGTLQLEQVNLTGTKEAPQKVSVSNNAIVKLVGMEDGNDLTMTELSIDAGTFGVYINGTPSAGANDANVGNLTLASGGKIVIGSSKDANVLEANLVTLGGSTLDFSSGGQLTMGCTLEVGEGTIIVLSDENFAKASEGEAITLFNSVEGIEMENYVRVSLKSAGGEQMLGEVSFQGDKATLSVKGIPEPTTGTLSLLALAGLCARRRRK